jgi:transposase-like protein
MTKYSPAFKEKVVQEYQRGVRGKGFAALSIRFKVPKSVIEDWWKRWEAGGRTVDAFEDQAGGDRRSILTEREKERYILDFVSHKNSKRKAVNYSDVTKNLRKKVKRLKKTDEEVLLRIVQRIGKEEMNLSWKETTNTLESDETQDYLKAVAAFRNKCQRVAKEKLIFLDGTGIKCEPRRSHGLAPKGKKALVSTKKQERYQARLDIWGAISYNKALAIDIQNSEDRKRKKVRGYGKKDVKSFLRKKVSPKVAEMKESVIVSMDRGFHFTPDEIEKELKDGGAKNIEDVWIFPRNAGKLCDPLDNTLWHSMKEKVRKTNPVDEKSCAKAVKKAFMGTSAKDLHSYYKKCSLTCGQDPYKDLNLEVSFV